MLKKLLHLAQPVWIFLALSTFCRIASQLAGAAVLLYPVWEITRPEPAAYGKIGLTVAVLAVCAASLRWAEQVSGHAAAFRLLAKMRVQLYDSLVARGSGNLSGGHGAGSIMSVATRDINAVEVFFAHTIAPLISAIMFSLAFLLLVFSFSSNPAAWVLAILCVGIAFGLPFLRKTGAEARLRGQISQHLSEDSHGFLEIISFGATSARLAKLAKLESQLAADIKTTGAFNGLRNAISTFWPWVGAAGIFLTTQSIFLSLCVLALAPIVSGVEAFARTLPRAWEASARYFALISAPVDIPEPANPQPLPAPSKTNKQALAVSYKNISLAYPQAPRQPRGKNKPNQSSNLKPHYILQDFSLHIPAGARIGIVGPSGSGKSTLVKALVRLVDPIAGSIELGGVNIADLKISDLRSAVGLVEQQAFILRGSVLTNMRLGNPQLSPDAARKYLDLAQARDISLEQEATALSGGEQQRVNLARVLARRPQVLVLDEATSHQDALRQKELAAILTSLEDTTVIMIAHRPAALVGVDKVIELPATRDLGPNPGGGKPQPTAIPK
ncbi:amino acid ABC transporter ATP-binding/permease protein [Corynebacterium caspium]|uniref:amino acid ABC transporter ATP-binding/permease protein n=1 Tax=Corynebacterium caspium TaxID=234828 RepID=UPI000370636E|nr:ABC transporter ATP-binding protein [Corynebacterium caspium]WKD59318.1 putative ABC transporter ATP-binding protein [Corynebacterium caspium DSM 44850]